MKNRNSSQFGEFEMLVLNLLVEICDKFSMLCSHFVPADKEKYLDTADVKQILKISDSTVYRLRKKRKIDFVKKDGKIYYLPSSIQRYLEGK